MKYKAVIFDLFGTLVCIASRHESESVLRQMASVLSVPADSLIELWRDTGDKRMNGVFHNYQGWIRFICNELGSSPDDSQVNLAAYIRFEMERRELMVLMDGAVEVLSNLKSLGHKIGLISNASFETATIWMDSPLSQLVDAAVFSATVGILKPDPRIYHTVTEQLAVKPEDCLYVADGGADGELKGASQVGMQAVQLLIPNHNDNDLLHEDWDGLSISSLNQVLSLVK